MSIRRRLATAGVGAAELTGAPRSASALYDLRRTWEDRYKIEIIDGVWQACRLGGGISIITADTPHQLAGLVREDHTAWQAAARRQQS
jgi:hypothetical protein